jgi:hypothetical protein
MNNQNGVEFAISAYEAMLKAEKAAGGYVPKKEIFPNKGGFTVFTGGIPYESEDEYDNFWQVEPGVEGKWVSRISDDSFQLFDPKNQTIEYTTPSREEMVQYEIYRLYGIDTPYRFTET